jgi:DNA-binding transcriptional LysR family regulator
MEFYPLRVFLTVANERSFSRAAEKLGRTQPAISLAVQRLEADFGEKLIDRSGKDLLLTDAGRVVIDFARRFENLQAELDNALAELRDNAAGRLVIGANESTTLYLLNHIEDYRHRFPRIKVQIRRSMASKIPGQLIDGDLELGLLTFNPDDDRLLSVQIFRDHVAFIVSPEHRFAGREEVSITELGEETFIAHYVVSPYRGVVIKAFQHHRVPLHMDVEMPTVESIRLMVQRNEGVAFLPHMCVEQDVKQGTLKEIRVPEVTMEREIHLVYPAKRNLSHAAKAFLDLVQEGA